MLIHNCPVCKHELTITKLSCRKCGLEITKDFKPGIFDSLNESQSEFLLNFIVSNGNLKKMEELTRLPYHQVKKQLELIKEALQLTGTSRGISIREIAIRELPVYENDSKVIRLLKEKINESGGLATVPLTRGNSFQIYYEEYGSGIHATNIPANKILVWQAFEDTISLLERKGGRVMKGNAMKGKLGDSYLPLDSVEGYVASHTYHVKKGETTLRLISALSAILEWIGCCHNGYGYLELL